MENINISKYTYTIKQEVPLSWHLRWPTPILWPSFLCPWVNQSVTLSLALQARPLNIDLNQVLHGVCVGRCSDI